MTLDCRLLLRRQRYEPGEDFKDGCWVVKRFLVYINFRRIFFFWSGLGLRKSLTFFILREPYL